MAALLLRLAVLLVLQGGLPQIGDASGYLYLAREYVRNPGTFTWLAAGVRPPLHRILLAPGLDDDPVPAEPVGAAPDAYPGVYLIQIAVDLLAIGLVMVVTRRRFGTRAALWAGWIGALYPQSVLLASGVVLAEGLAAFASALALLALDAVDRALDEGRAGAIARATAVLGLALGVGILTKEILLPVTIVFAAALLLRPATPWTTRLLVATGATVLALLVALPWALHNRKVHGVLIWSGTFGDYAKVADNPPPGGHGARLWLKQPSVAARAELADRVLRDALLQYPGLTAQRALVRLRIGLGPDVMLPAYWAIGLDGFQPATADDFAMSRSGWTLPEGWGRRVQLLSALGTLVLFGLAVGGLCLVPRGTLQRAFVLMALVLLVTLALTVADGRYRHGLLPFALPFAGLAAALLTSRDERERWPAALRRRALIGGAVATVALALTVLVLPAP